MTWRLCVDRGGTFTDVILVDPEGRVHAHKLLSQDDDGREGVARALAEQRSQGHELAELRLGTTVATNALLERRGAPVLLLLTAGFGDLLELGDQRRPELFALAIERQRPLSHEVLEVDERLAADGSLVRPLDLEPLRERLRGVQHLAVCFVHADRHPQHELAVETFARELGVAQITLSHRTSPAPGYLARASTTLADAALTPVLTASLEAALPDAPALRLAMQSSGGLVRVEQLRGKDAVLSGPAGGVVAVRELARRAGHARALGLDMGGTSTDVCRHDEDEAPWVQEGEIDGIRLRAPRLDLVTVAAGGGSLLRLVDGRFLVGPQSAGAQPGPACYGRGGPPTLTDAALVLGLLRPAFFDALPLDVTAARAALSRFGDPVEAARGFLAVAHETTADALRELSVARGHDPREHLLVAFGGAGAQHACALARRLGIRDVLVPAHAGLLSAWGLSRADLVTHAERPLRTDLAEPDFPRDEAIDALRAQGAEHIETIERVDVRYVGAASGLTLPWSPSWRQDFAAAHEKRFGFQRPGHAVEITAARVEARCAAGLPWAPAAPTPEHAAVPHPDPQPEDGTAHDGRPLFERDQLAPGALLHGPALVVERNATTVIDAGWSARVDGDGQLRLRDTRPGAPPLALGVEADPVGLELVAHRFMAIATEMGEQLRRVAHSVNIKERHDYSCALFDARGQLLANAPHIPVHLGAMGECVRDVLSHVELVEGDAWLSNDPGCGGSHLPDLTVVTPVFHDGELLGFVANRGHHADIGGSTPGSMPPHSTRLEEEGALLRRVLLLRDGALREGEVRARLEASGTRDIEERLADLRAQVACNSLGAQRLRSNASELGAEALRRWMAHLLDHGETVMAEVVRELRPGAARDALDDGTVLAVSLREEAGHAIVDFEGTGPRGAHNRHAPRAVVKACVLFVFRCLAQRELPLNEGCLRRLDVRIPAGCLLDPQPGDAVVGGNVETSQRLVGLLLRALGLAGASQGTMNNLTFGDADFGCYETLGGGSGASFGHDGAHGIHAHMTNTAITDVEPLELRHPVRVERFARRHGSGGAGVWRGGDGLIRELRFLRPLQASLLAESRVRRPRGLRAADGKPGAERLSTEGAWIATPGGGGFTPSAAEWAALSAREARELFAEDRWRGPTRGIARAARRAQLLAVAPADLANLLAHLGPEELLWQGALGETQLPGRDAPIALSEVLPLYEWRGASSDGRRPGALLESRARWWLGASTHLVIVHAADARTRALRFPHGGGAPGRELLLDP